MVERLGAALEKIARSPLHGRALLLETVQVVLDYFDENRDFMAQVGLGRLPGCGERSSAAVMERFADNYRHMRDILQRCADDGLLEARELDVAASFLFGLCRSSMLFYSYMRKGRKPVAARRDEVMEMFLKGAGRHR